MTTDTVLLKIREKSVEHEIKKLDCMLLFHHLSSAAILQKISKDSRSTFGEEGAFPSSCQHISFTFSVSST